MQIHARKGPSSQPGVKGDAAAGHVWPYISNAATCSTLSFCPAAVVLFEIKSSKLVFTVLCLPVSLSRKTIAGMAVTQSRARSPISTTRATTDQPQRLSDVKAHPKSSKALKSSTPQAYRPHLASPSSRAVSVQLGSNFERHGSSRQATQPRKRRPVKEYIQAGAIFFWIFCPGTRFIDNKIRERSYKQRNGGL